MEKRSLGGWVCWFGVNWIPRLQLKRLTQVAKVGACLVLSLSENWDCDHCLHKGLVRRFHLHDPYPAGSGPEDARAVGRMILNSRRKRLYLPPYWGSV